MNHLTSHEVPGRIKIKDLAPGYPCVIISNQNASAKIALHGAHVIDFTPTGQQPVIFTSDEAIYREGKAIRGGVPVCWPWFSGHPTDSSQPAHGFARNAFWKLTDSETNDVITRLVFSYSKGNLNAELTIKIGKELSIDLKTTNIGNHLETVGGALHSYFSISDIDSIAISGLEDVKYHDSLTDQQGQDSEMIKFSAELDRVYLNTTDTVTLHDAGWCRDIIIEKSGSQSTVVWNPWIEKSAGMADLGNDDYLRFVCIETANALQDTYQLAPGETHRLSTTIKTKYL